MSGRSGEDTVDTAPGTEKSAASLEESQGEVFNPAVAAVRLSDARTVEEAKCYGVAEIDIAHAETGVQVVLAVNRHSEGSDSVGRTTQEVR